MVSNCFPNLVFLSVIKMKKSKILATSWHPGGINSIIPVIKKLQRDSLVEVVTIGSGFSKPILDQAKINYNTIQDYSIQDVSTESMQELLENESPDLVLTGTSNQNGAKDVIEQTIALASKEKQIPCLAVLDVWMIYWQRFSDIYTKDNKKFQFLPDKIAIMDRYAKKAMLEEGFPKENLVITGNPHFDDLETKANSFTIEDKQRIRRQIGLDNDILLFYAANVWENYKEEYGFWDLDNIQLINEVLENNSNTGLVIKLHPRTPKQDCEKINKYINEQGGKRIRLVSEINPQDLVLASDATLTSNSTLGFEAVYMHRPCISLQPGLKTKDYLEILTKNLLIPVEYSMDNCRELVQKVILDKNYRGQLLEMASEFRTDGKATERVTELLYSMIE